MARSDGLRLHAGFIDSQLTGGRRQEKYTGGEKRKLNVNQVAAINSGDQLSTRTWRAGVTDPVVAQPFPYIVEVQQGQTYKWCACGRSSAQPFCDNSHDGTGIEPVLYIAESTKNVQFCGCKASKRGAVCDSSHNNL